MDCKSLSGAGPSQAARAPSGGSDDTKCGAWGSRLGAGPSQAARAPSGGSDGTKCGAWGSYFGVVEHVLHVVEVFERVEQFLHSGGILACELDGVFRAHRDFGHFGLKPRGFQRVL